MTLLHNYMHTTHFAMYFFINNSVSQFTSSSNSVGSISLVVKVLL